MFVSPVGSGVSRGIPEELRRRYAKLNKQIRHKHYWKELRIDEKDIEKYLISGFKNFPVEEAQSIEEETQETNNQPSLSLIEKIKLSYTNLMRICDDNNDYKDFSSIKVIIKNVFHK